MLRERDALRQPQPMFYIQAHAGRRMKDSDDWPIDQGRPWGLRLLALVGALAFVMLGINSLLLVFQQPRPLPVPAQTKRG